MRRLLLSSSTIWIAAQSLAAQPSSTRSIHLDPSAIVAKNFGPLVESSTTQHSFKSLIVGVVTPFGVSFHAFGQTNGQAPHEKNLFEIASITKGVLGLALADAEIYKGLNPDAALGATISTPVPSYNGERISWKHLAQHSSGLPPLPTNLNPSDPLQPYENYSSEKLTEFLSSYSLPRPPGEVFVYSNLGAGLLGHALEKVYSQSLEDIFRTRIFDIIGMPDTRIHLNAEQEARMLPGFINSEASEAWRWSNSAIPGLGALRSTPSDMTELLQALMGLKHTSFAPVVELATQASFKVSETRAIANFWVVENMGSQKIVWHNGASYASSSFIGFDPARRIGIVALSNSAVIQDGAEALDSRIDEASIKTLSELAQALVSNRK